MWHTGPDKATKQLPGRRFLQPSFVHCPRHILLDLGGFWSCISWRPTICLCAFGLDERKNLHLECIATNQSQSWGFDWSGQACFCKEQEPNPLTTPNVLCVTEYCTVFHVAWQEGCWRTNQSEYGIWLPAQFPSGRLLHYLYWRQGLTYQLFSTPCVDRHALLQTMLVNRSRLWVLCCHKFAPPYKTTWWCTAVLLTSEISCFYSGSGLDYWLMSSSKYCVPLSKGKRPLIETSLVATWTG